MSDTKPKIYYLGASEAIRYADPTEPHKYPDLFIPLVEFSAYAYLKRELEDWKHTAYTEADEVVRLNKELDAVKAERDELKELVREARRFAKNYAVPIAGKVWLVRARKALGDK